MLEEIETEGQIRADPIMFAKHRRNVSDSDMGMSHDDREIAVGDLAFPVVAAFRRQPHINNVLAYLRRELAAGGASSARNSRSLDRRSRPDAAGTQYPRSDVRRSRRHGPNSEAIFSRSPCQDPESSPGRA